MTAILAGVSGSVGTPKPPTVAERGVNSVPFMRKSTKARSCEIYYSPAGANSFQHYLAGPRNLNPRNGVLISSDGGKTYQIFGWIRISPNDDYRGWAENNVVELQDGSLAMLIRADGLGGVLYRSDSRDGGRTWTDGYRTDIPNPGTKIALYNLGGGRVAILHNPDPKSRNPLALWISSDGMKTWPYRRVLSQIPEHVLKGRVGSMYGLNDPDGVVAPTGNT